MVCKRCGHALPSNSAVCPNCGMMMSREQLKIRKDMNGANNAYISRLDEIRDKNIKNRNQETTNTNVVGYAIFIIIIFLCIAIIIGLSLLKRS